VLESLYYQRKLEGTVVDGCCGAGTLGLVAVLAGAREVILKNDAFRPAVKNTILNIRANASILGLDPEPEIHADISKLPLIADTGTPRLVATAHGDGASGSADISVYHGDLADLAAVIDRCDLCLVDAFIGVSTDRFVQAWKERAGVVVTI
jgi:predicted nicotinamide N-methyase